jgi:hypothetical protein
VTCAPLASTGVPALALIAAAAFCLGVGGALLWLTRERPGRRGAAITVVLLVLATCGLTTAIAGLPSAHANPRCTVVGQPNQPSRVGPGRTGHQSLTIAQTSRLIGLAPGVRPESITGTITNSSPASAIVTAVSVSVAGVTTASAATPGACDASDYVLIDPVMPVGRILAAGQSVVFAGAWIGFNNKATNQDACKGAIVHLRYLGS